ncbi:ciliary microtubule inner protein 5 [Gouania willdenowi]|uniref:Uncharacterized protein n=1 Tax=Gouania willdenowi TaxID=441366 RepID=A0A8C5N7X4_GOUWI|nr:uncharacterized protein C2orf50 homolog [Gouania willdenowi]XP_028294872.1 uncharacterized protein C2orf50 homolog [Gouania willdenowi]
MDHGMDRVSVRRASSAGYRLPTGSHGIMPVTSAQPPDRTRHTRGSVHVALDLDHRNPVQRDRLWREMVKSERRAVLEWEKNWSFLESSDHLGWLRSEEPFPNDGSLSSDSIPHTSNQVLGSRLSTTLADTLLTMDRLVLWAGGHHHRGKKDPEMLPC